MPTKNNKKRRVFGRNVVHKHKLEESRDKKEPYIPTFFGMGLVAVIFFMLLFVGVGVASATDYYVATDGDDSYPGSEAQPWRTIQKAANSLVAGDTVYIKSGTYNEKVTPQNSGSPGDYITYTAYPGHTVTLDGTGIAISYNHGLFDIRESYIKVSGLQTINSEWAGIMVGYTQHSIIEDCYTYNTASHGIGVTHSTDIIIDGNEVEKANVGPPYPPGGEAITIAVTERFEVKNNHVHHCTEKEGIDAKVRCRNGKIYRNLVHDITNEYGIGIYVDSCSDIDVFENVVYNVNNKGTGIVLGLEVPYELENIGVYNNIVYNCVHGYVLWADVEGPIRNLTFINNVGYNNEQDGIFITDVPRENLIIRNNIFSENKRYQIHVEGIEVITDHNLIDGPTQITGDDYVEGDPKFVNPAAVDFHLQEDSFAIDSGSSVDAPSDDFDGNPRPQGAGYDIGAYEFVVAGATGTISGTVKDKGTGNPIQGAAVTTNGYSEITNAAGGYTITLPVGTYTVTVSKAGYQSQSQENVVVLEDQTTTVDFQLTEALDLVGFWRFDEGSGTITEDSSGNGNDGTLINGPAWVDGQVGKALSFDGTYKYVDCGNDPSLDITSQITVEAWVKPNSLTGDRAILGKKSGYAFKIRGAEIRFTTPGIKDHTSSGAGLVVDSWQHVAVVFIANDIVKFYKNGQFISQTSASGMHSSTYPLLIGNNQWNQYSNGVIDEVRIYNRALSAEEVKADYEAVVNSTYPRYDVNEDGKVDDLDITIEGQHLGEITN